MNDSKNTNYSIEIGAIKFSSSDALLNHILVLDKTRLYHSNQPYKDPNQPDVLDQTHFGSGVSVGYEYDLRELTLSIKTEGGICATRVEGKGFAANELLIGLIDQQYDFLDFMKSVCEKEGANPIVSFKCHKDAEIKSEKKIAIMDYLSKF